MYAQITVNAAHPCPYCGQFFIFGTQLNSGDTKGLPMKCGACLNEFFLSVAVTAVIKTLKNDFENSINRATENP